MSAAPTTMAKVDNILKEVYLPGINDQLQSETVTLKRIQSTTKGFEVVGGKYVRFATKMARNHGIGARREMEALPAARVPTWKDGTQSLTYQYGAVQLSGQSFDLAESNPQAFASVLDSEMADLRENLAKDTNRQVYGTSRGTLATAASGTTTTFVATDAAMRNVEVDMLVDLWDITATAHFDSNGPFTITSVVSSGGNTTATFTPAASAAVAAGDLMSRAGNAIDGTTGKEIIGFSEIVADSGTLHNIDPSTYTEWVSYVNSNGGTPRAISESLMAKVMINVRRQGARPSVIFTTPEVMLSYFNLLSQQREFVNTKTFTGGHEGLAFNYGGEIPVVDDVDCPSGKMFFISEKELRLFQAQDWGFLNRQGSNWVQVRDASGDYDAWTANLRKYYNMGTLRRNAHALLSDITEA